MPDTKITALTAISTVNPATYPLPIVDTADTTMAASGTTKKITVNQILGAGGTATLASATITGDLTVDTSTLYVSSSADKVGIGTTSLSNEKLTVAGNISANAWLGRSNISVPTGDCSIFRSADNTLGFGIASTTAMTLNSTGLGVGVSPSYKLDVLGSATISGRFKTSGALNALYLEDGGTTPGSLYIGTSGDTFRIITGSNVRMNVDVNGNVGIGVTPSAWNVTFKGIDISTGGAIAGSSDSVRLFSNSAFNTAGNNVYKNTAAAGRYDLQGNVHTWNVAPSGTAGTAITFTQAMTLDASGNLGVGITNPSNRLHALVSSGADRDIFAAQVLAASNGLQVKWNHATTTLRVILANIPTSSSGLASGTLWNDAGTIKIA